MNVLDIFEYPILYGNAARDLGGEQKKVSCCRCRRRLLIRMKIFREKRIDIGEAVRGLSRSHLAKEVVFIFLVFL